MTIVCWGNLAKAADSVTRIEQSMEDYVSGHQQDPNAHMAAGYSLGDHRSQEELDHAIYSILNKYTYPQIRTYKAIVDPAGYGDLTDIQTAIDYVEGLGGGAVLAKAGIYTLSDNIIVPTNVILEGEGVDLTILDFNSTAKNLRLVGASDGEEEITWGLPHDSATVTGVGTAFESHASAGDSFMVGGVPYKIATVDSNTVITLQEIYEGVAKVGQTDYTTKQAVSNAGVKSLTVTGSGGVDADTGSGIVVFLTSDCKIENVVSRNNNYYGFSIYSNYNLKIDDANAKGNRQTGYFISSNRAVGMIDCQSVSNEGYGFFLQSGGANSVGLTRCEAYQNDLDGFYFNSCTYMNLVQCISDYNSRDGFRANSGDWDSMIGCRANYNEGYGFNNPNSTTNELIILGNIARLNITGNFNDAAPDTHVAHNAFV